MTKAHDDRVGRGPVGCGLDVLATTADASRPLEVAAAGGEPYHRYALILVD